MGEVEQLQETIEVRIREFDPKLELVALERPANESLRLFVDHPDGVDLARCEGVTDVLRDLLERFSLEVSSPGADRPLTKPDHYRRFLGRRVKVRTREAIDGQRSFTGTLAAADERSVSIDANGDTVTIPLARIRRSNLVPEFPTARAGGRAT